MKILWCQFWTDSAAPWRRSSVGVPCSSNRAFFFIIKLMGGLCQAPLSCKTNVRSLFHGKDSATPYAQVHLHLCRSSSMQLGRICPFLALVSAGLPLKYALWQGCLVRSASGWRLLGRARQACARVCGRIFLGVSWLS